MSTAAPTAYAIRVHGHLDDHWSTWFGGLTVTRNSDGTSTLTGAVADQAQLHGALAGLRDIGATLLDLRATDLAGAGQPANPSQPNAGRPVLEHPLHTERLTLRPARVDDADPTWTFRQVESVNEWLTGCPADIAGYRDRFGDPTRLATTVVIQLGHDSAAEVIGDFMLRRADTWGQLAMADQVGDAQAELGWVFDPAHHGHGYATEAARALLRYCFEDLDLRRITAHCLLGNDSFRRLMEHVGMRRELHAVRAFLHRSGRWLDIVGYALLAEEWKDDHTGADAVVQPGQVIWI